MNQSSQHSASLGCINEDYVRQISFSSLLAHTVENSPSSGPWGTVLSKPLLYKSLKLKLQQPALDSSPTTCTSMAFPLISLPSGGCMRS